jgi:homoserine O-acetyltransferase
VLRRAVVSSSLRASASRFVRVLAVVALVGVSMTTPAQADPERHTFVLRDFRTESGVVVPELRVVYGTYGKLDAARGNAILLPSHYMARLTGYEWLIRSPKSPDLALDPAKDFLVTTELFGNGSSSSPSNTPPPFDGPRFPVMTVRDNVEAVHRLLVDGLGIRHLKAVIGFSMGAQQAFQWAVSHPGFMDRIVATAGTAKTYGHGIVRLEGQIAAIEADPTFAAGDYATPPERGLQAFGMVWAGWLFSQEWWRRELWRGTGRGDTLTEVIATFRTRFIPGADANDLIAQMRTWQSNDVGATPAGADHPAFRGDVAAALRSIKVPVLYMPSETDLYFPVGDARYEASFIPRVELVPIPSLWGHTAGAASNPADRAFLNEHIARFLAGSSGEGAARRPAD